MPIQKLETNNVLKQWMDTINTIIDDSSSLESLLNEKVDKETGKGLSTNDFTNTLKDKLDGIEEGANNYTLPTANNATKGGVTLSDSTSSESGTDDGIAATPKAVKIAYDLASNALPKAGGTIEGDLIVTGKINATIEGNTDTANKLSVARTIALTGDVSGSTTFDGTKDVSITVTVADNSHNHTVENIDNLETILATKAGTTSPTFVGTPKAPTAQAGTNTTQIATTAFVQSAIDSKIATADAMIFKGTIGTNGTVTALPAEHSIGWTYKVATVGIYAGVNCEVGDMIVCLVDGNEANDADWTVIQANIDGSVIGPASAVEERIAVFSGTTGKVIKDSGFTIASSVPADAKFTDTTYNVGSAVEAGITKLYTETGSNTDGTINQDALTTLFEGKLGVEDTAVKATSDASGNVITTTYATKKELSNVGDSLADVATSGSYNDLSDKPTALKNPTSLTIQDSAGTSIGSYDGSTATTVKLTSSIVGLGNVTNESKATMFTSPSFIGTPTAPTATSGTNTTQIATTEFVNKAIADLVDSAPETLNTLGEIASALSENVEVTDVLNEAIATKANDSDVVKITGEQSIDGVKTFTSTISGSVSGNAGTADKLKTSHTIALTGDVSGFVKFDGSEDVSIAVTVADDSHNHTIENIDTLETVLATKAGLSSPSFIGTPTAPTASDGTNTTQIATTEFVTTAVNNAVDGAVYGPSKSTDSAVTVFDGVTGKVVKDSGFTIASSVPANAKFTDTTYTVGTTNYSGTTKLYTSVGDNTDGTINQSVLTTLLSGKLGATDTAVRATSDANGNNIASTYATKEELSNVGDSLADVATSGSYNDLSDTPTSLKNPTSLTILNSAGTSVGSYDGSTATTVKLTSATVGLGNVTNESKATMFTSPAFTGTPTAPTVSNTTNTTQIATTAFVQSVVDSKIAASDAMIYKGTIGTGGTVTALPNTHSTGWTYKVITSGTYAGVKCNVGDMIICLTDGTAANNAHWTVVEGNIDGAVTGPVSSVASNVAIFDGATGKVIKDSGFSIASSVPSDAKFTDTTYTGSDGITLMGTNFTNSGVRSISSGATNGTISVNTNGTAAEVAVKGLGTAAYTASTAYAPSSHTSVTANGNTLGHVKLSDSTSSTSGVTGGFAATPVAVKIAYDLASDALPKAGGTITGDLTVEGVLEASVSNAATADKLSSAGTITLDGGASGSVTFDGSDATLTVTIVDDSHNHTVENIDNLETLLASKSAIASPTFTGSPKAPTAAAGTNTTQIATTEFVTTAVSTKANDSDVVKLSGDQTVAGNKTFSGRIIVSNDTDIGGATANSGAFIVGSVSGNHIGIGPNEIIAKATDTTSGTLNLQTDGGTIICGGTTDLTLFTVNATTSSFSGTLTASAVYNAVWNDYAEFFPRGEETKAGDFVALSLDSDNEVYVKASKETSKSVGIHSDSFGHLIGGEQAPEGQDFVEYNLPKYIPVGLVGRVRANIVGEVKKGDFIVISNIPGVGRAFNKEIDSYMDIIGMACESSSEKEIKRIKVKLGN